MKFVFASLLFLGTLCGEWHSCLEAPKEGNLFMQEFLELDCSNDYNGHYFIISRYKKSRPLNSSDSQGWWDVTKDELWQWIEEGKHLIYVP